MSPPLKLILTVAGAAVLCATLAIRFVGGTATATAATATASGTASADADANATANAAGTAPGAGGAGGTEKPALTVTVTQLRTETLPIRLSANGNVMAWQEALIGAEANGLRLAEVAVNVGDTVRRGQLLASFAADTVEAELAQRRAETAAAVAALGEAAGNARRARALEASGAMAQQQVQQSLAAELSAQARLDAARAVEELQRLRLRQTRLLAPDDGIVSARAATVGAVVPAGQELFRLIRRGRLEWRAEVAAPDLARIRPGQAVRVTLADGVAIAGEVRMVSPVVDAFTRNGLVYVDLPAPGAARAGSYAQGEFDLGASAATTLPRGAVQMREGLVHALRVDADQRVTRTRLRLGRQAGDRIEVLEGLDRTDRVVASGIAFLGDRDRVRVVEAQR
ncbi:efflux RND transporter periplasmic adaptor subunit [Mitsuaria sp. GD03876]|uniref:efflux RND transporter periplasmic adaptor subunit n=1 Tax=Mitsuaria sp. GD03876 TaxID=2975399 RepID=UPI002448A622|nr:efflux RND transporter periplasmic adaptor subunit [Mitsuaria sp. GD03876]MDH0864698.1 efflux RND transporter periplasmic adaptor subunit [Mitsuaria sp. GD03876]